MGLFSKKKNKKNLVVWRDASGKIACPGDHCPKDCDDTCPIYLNTQAGMLWQIGMGDKAMPIFQRIIEIAPDFYDPWNNMGAVYGSQGNLILKAPLPLIRLHRPGKCAIIGTVDTLWLRQDSMIIIKRSKTCFL